MKQWDQIKLIVSKKYFLFKEAIFEVNKRENNVC